MINIICGGWIYCPVLNEIIDVDSLQFDFDTIHAATNNFSEENKVGEGGFGVVYKVLNTNTSTLIYLKSNFVYRNRSFYISGQA